MSSRKRIGHGGHIVLALPYPYRLHQNDIKSGGFAQQNGFAGALGDAAQTSGGGRRADEGIRLSYELFHTGFVAQNTAPRKRRTGINGQHRNLMSPGYQEHAQRFNEGALPYPPEPR